VKESELLDVFGCADERWDVLQEEVFEDVAVERGWVEPHGQAEKTGQCDGRPGERDDAQDAANVEVAQKMRLRGLQITPEDAGDEKAGEDEEDLDPGPSGGGEMSEEANQWVVRGESAAVVEDEDEGHGETTETVEGGFAVVWSGDGVWRGHLVERSESGGQSQLRDSL